MGYTCKVCGADMGFDAPSGVCSEACLRRGQGFRVTFDDTPDEGADHTYFPQRLPGMPDVAQPEQGLLWADLRSARAARKRGKPEPADSEPCGSWFEPDLPTGSDATGADEDSGQ